MWLALAAVGLRADEEHHLPKVGTSLARTLAGGEAHRFPLTLDRDEDLYLEVTQGGIDVILRLFGPDGSGLIEIDNPNGQWGRESLLFRAKADVEYVVEIRSPAPGVAPGRYSLGVERRVGDSVEDRLRLTAERAASEAGRLNVENTSAALAQALSQLREALVAWRRLQQDAAVARTHFLLAMIHGKLGQAQAGLTELRQALALWQGLEDRRGTARALIEMGSVARRLGETEEAVERYREGLVLWRQLGDRSGQARTLNYLGLVHARTTPQGALLPYQQALQLFRQIGDIRQEGRVLNNLGGVFDLLGEPVQALQHYQLALALHHRAGDRKQQAAVWNNVASIHRRTGRLQEALETYRLALEARRQLGDRRGEARVLNNLGMTYWRLGDLARSRSTLQAALALRRKAGDRRGEALTLSNLGLSHAAQGEQQAAIELYSKALDLWRENGDRRGEATTLIDLARVEKESGQLTRATEYLEDALALLEHGAHRWRQGLALTVLGEVSRASGDAPAAIAQLERALGIFRATGDAIGESAALVALARAKGIRLDGHDGPQIHAAYRHSARALELLEARRADVDSLGLRTSLLARHATAFELAMDLAMRLHRLDPTGGWAGNALEISERARARNLLDLLKESRAGLRQTANRDLLTRQKGLLERLSLRTERRRRLFGQPEKSIEAKRLAGEEREILTQLEDIDNEIRRQSPAWGAIVHPKPLRARAIRALLDPGTLLLQYALGEDKTYLWSVTDQAINSFELPGRAAIESTTRRAYEGLRLLDPRAQAADAAALHQLSEIVLGPVAHRLTDQRLVIVADGALHYLPFAALPHPLDDSEPLLARHEVIALPSASALAVQRRTLATRPTAPKGLAILADPVFGPPDSRLDSSGSLTAEADVAASVRLHGHRLRNFAYERLAWSRWEAEAIAAHAGKDQAALSLGFDANLDAVAGERLRDYRMVHFATHGIIDAEHPELSALVLSMHDVDGKPRDGFLRLPEIYNLQLDAELVVLSGCRTALGPEVRGEGLVGLTRGFFAAGARRLVASLWRVQDRAAAELMDRFYRRLLADPVRPERINPAAALRQAQLELRAEPEFRDPYYWAAFAVYGDWRR